MTQGAVHPIRKIEVRVCKVDAKLGLVMGFALICAVKNASGVFEPYFDQGSVDEAGDIASTGELVSDHISEAEMIKAVTDFMKSDRVAKTNHEGEQTGGVVHSMPITEDLLKATGMDSPMTGWLVAMAPGPEMLKRFQSGELTGFSIGGKARRVAEAA